MSEEIVELYDDHIKEALEEVIENEQFKEYKIIVTAASKKGDNYLGILKRVKVTGVKKNGKKGNLSLVIKLSLKATTLREKFPLGNLYTREVFAYGDVLPRLSRFEEYFNIPASEKFKHVKCYKASTEEFKEYLILEDMKACGYEMSNRKCSLNIQQMRLALKSLAKFHALSFGFKHKNPQKYEELTKDLLHPFSIENDFVYYINAIKDRALAVLDDAASIECLKSFGIDLVDKMSYFLCPSTAEPYNVICHGDCWVNNMLFKNEGDEPVDVSLLDWQIMRHTSPVTDIAYLIFTSTDAELRKNHYHELIDFYYSSLKTHLDMMDLSVDDLYPETVYRNHLKLLMPYGLLMALIVIPMIVSEVEDTVDIEAPNKKDKIELSDMVYKNEKSANRYKSRIQGIVGDFVRFKLI